MPNPKTRFLGTGSFLPEQVRTNDDIRDMGVDTCDEWISTRTGIRERRIAAPTMQTSDMATAAAIQALEMAELSAQDLDMVIVATVTGDMPMPATAAFVQQKLGAPNCPAFDLSAACAGFIYGINVGDQFIRSGQAKHILVVGVELLSRAVDWKDRTTCVLFGDGAGAVVLGPSDDHRGILATKMHTDGSLAHSLKIPWGGLVEMQGRDIFKAAVRNLHSASKAVVEEAGIAPEQVDWVVPHQANIRIIEQVTSRADYPRQKVLSNIATVGNTSSASIPILLDESIRNNTVKEGDVVLMCALGAGVSWGASVVCI